MNRRYAILIAVMVFGMLAVLALYLPGVRPEALGTRTVAGTAEIGGAFRLIDQKNDGVTADSLNGRYLLVFFGFTNCPDICPLTLQTVTEALQIAGPTAENVYPVFITVDPERDTPAAMGDYVSHFHPRTIALTGSIDAVKQAADAYRVFFRKAALETPGEYTMEHSGFVYFMGRDGVYITHFRPGATAKEMAARIRQETAFDR